MTTKTYEQMRADFEAWYEQEFEPIHGPLVRDEHNYPRSYENVDHALMWEAYQAGRAAAYDSASRMEQMREDEHDNQD